MLLSDKYAAGFFDGDGALYVQDFAYATGQTGKRLFLEVCQQARCSGVIEAFAKWFPGGTLDWTTGRRRGVETHRCRLRYSGQRAVDVLCRLKPYLVTKRVRANRILRELGFTERVGTDSVPVHPSRKWLAGYFDADGCIYAGVQAHGGSAAMQFSIDTDDQEQDGIELVQKAFGGVIRHRGAGNAWRWETKACASKARVFFSFFAQHLLIKQEQAYFVMGCAAMGHFRDGQIISDTLKVMKTHPHRLSDLTTEVDVSAALTQVRDLQREDGGIRYRAAAGQTCHRCGGSRLYARGFCNPCWQVDRYNRSKRQSELAA